MRKILTQFLKLNNFWYENREGKIFHILIKEIMVILFLLMLFFSYTFAQSNSNQATGSITIDAVQMDVEVYLDGEYYGTARGPSTIENCSPGKHKIRVSK